MTSPSDGNLAWAEGPALAVIEERERIANELEGTLAQLLGYVNMKAQSVVEYLAAGDASGAARNAEDLVEAARSAYADLRESVLGLRTPLTADRRLSVALQSYLEEWQDQTGITVNWDREAAGRVLDSLSPAAEIQLLRIIQEALSNARKHAHADRITLRFGGEGGWLRATVEDDGVGFDPSSSAALSGSGLLGMRERAAAVRATLQIDSSPGSGTRVTARVRLVEG